MQNNYKEIKGDLIELALDAKFDVIAHGCNCFCSQNAGIAKQMSDTFDTDSSIVFYFEGLLHKGSYKKLGNIEYSDCGTKHFAQYITVVNCYTQYHPGPDLDYIALEMCLKKINHKFKGKHLGLPQIGCGIAGGDWSKVKEIIQRVLTDVKVTVVIYEKH